jgi:chromosome segregation ATPase
MVSFNEAEQIEMLKQQITVYADDFANERSDRERIQADREAQKEVIKEFEREIKLLKEQVRVFVLLPQFISRGGRITGVG